MTFMINKEKNQYTSNKLGCRKYQLSYKIKSEQKNGRHIKNMFAILTGIKRCVVRSAHVGKFNLHSIGVPEKSIMCK